MEKLTADHLSICYAARTSQKPFLALQDVTFQIREQEFVALVGPSGCGKSTLLLVIAGLMPIYTGRIQLDGKDITGPGYDRGMVFQSSALMPWRTVVNNVPMGWNYRDIRLKKQPIRQSIILPWLD